MVSKKGCTIRYLLFSKKDRPQNLKPSVIQAAAVRQPRQLPPNHLCAVPGLLAACRAPRCANMAHSPGSRARGAAHLSASRRTRLGWGRRAGGTPSGWKASRPSRSLSACLIFLRIASSWSQVLYASVNRRRQRGRRTPAVARTTRTCRRCRLERASASRGGHRCGRPRRSSAPAEAPRSSTAAFRG